ncbi:HSP20-like chaperone [Jimgerdemannia flammicorona]|uniref:HSP20-like chaperone n=1 Tax=Jimgerdemannia flammicorona TaxID=994334 RepID=A0A433D634_9FUNG|nr:HSP20-like chaperone [Jimgerdemannia flammicorona]
MSLINRVFPEIFRDAGRAFAMLDDPFLQATRRSIVPGFGSLRPAVDISETDKAYVLEAEVPGMKKKDLDIEFTDDTTLIVKGKIERSSETGAGAGFGAKDESIIEQGENQQQQSTDVVSAEGPQMGVSDPRQTWWSSERVLGSFQRSFTFPGKIDPANVKATYKDGVLTITVPKPESKVNKITID